MNFCRHTEWIRLWNNGETELEVSDRPSRLLEELPDDTKPAGFITLLGNQVKSLLLADLCPQLKTITTTRQNGEIHLHVSNVRPTTPVIIGDGSIPNHNRLPTAPRSYQCHETVHKVLSPDQRLRRASELTDEAYQKLLFPFADVICLFVADIGGTDSAVRRITHWVANERLTSTSSTLLLISSRGQKSAMKLAIENLKFGGYSLHDQFLRVEIMTLSPSRNSLWQKRQITRLRQRVFHMTRVAQEARQRTGSLFSARHATALMQLAADDVDGSLQLPIDFIVASRKYNPVASDLSSHLINWFKQYDNVDALERIAVPAAASSFILDQYPPGMHREC